MEQNPLEVNSHLNGKKKLPAYYRKQNYSPYSQVREA